MQKAASLAIFGPAGAGKATLCFELMNIKPIFKVVSSYTTRPAKPEKHGKIYFHVTSEEFQKLLADGNILEHNFYDGHYYGTSRDSFDQILAEGNIPFFDIDINGLVAIKEKGISVYAIFIDCELEEIERRLSSRGTESDKNREERMRTAQIEIPKAKELAKEGIIDEIFWYGSGAIPTESAKKIFDTFFF